MKTITVSVIAFFFLFAAAERAETVLGIPDPVRGATLLVPMFEVGIDSVVNPHDTLPVVTNLCNGTVKVHLLIWDKDGNPLAQDNFILFGKDSQPFTMRGVIDSVPAIKPDLTDGDFYHGYVTFDLVTVHTPLVPTDPSYPFSNANCLIGQIYYTRLTQGSSNGTPMVSLEASSTTDVFLHGFYTPNDTREEIDADSRNCVDQLSHGEPCTGSPHAGGVLSGIFSRVFLDPGLNGGTKLVIFAKPEGRRAQHTRAGNVPFTRWDETGRVRGSGNLILDHVVNIFNLPGSENGVIGLFNIPNGFEIYAYSINSAGPASDPALTWDAIFESFIDP